MQRRRDITIVWNSTLQESSGKSKGRVLETEPEQKSKQEDICEGYEH